jgi:hypothetical protein
MANGVMFATGMLNKFYGSAQQVWTLYICNSAEYQNFN